MTSTSDASAVSDEDRTALTDTVTRFARNEIAPHVDAWDAAGEFPRSLYRRAADLGLLGLGYPGLAIEDTTPVFDNLRKRGLIAQPVFAFYLST